MAICKVDINTWQGSNSPVKHFSFPRQYLNSEMTYWCPRIKISHIKIWYLHEKSSYTVCLKSFYSRLEFCHKVPRDIVLPLFSVLGINARSCHIVTKRWLIVNPSFRRSKLNSQDAQTHVDHIIIGLQSNLEWKVIFILKLSNSNINSVQKSPIKFLFQPR